MRNSFINLAVPIMQFSEPGEVEKINLTPELKVTVWDRWEVPCTRKLAITELFRTLEDKYKLKPRDLIYGSMPIYLAATMDLESKKPEKDVLVARQLREVLNLDESVECVDLTVTFSKLEGGELLKNTPPIRLIFDSEPEKPEAGIDTAVPALAASASAAPHNNEGANEDGSISDAGSVEEE